MLSGIGNSAELSELGIETFHHNPSVGSNLTDHVLVANVYEVTSNGTYDDLLRTPELMAIARQEWTVNRTGPLTAGVGNHVAYLRMADNASIFETVEDPSAGPASSHFEILMAVCSRRILSYEIGWKTDLLSKNLWLVHGVRVPATGHFTSFSTVVISPTSR